MTIGLRDYAFDDVPASVTAGTSIGVTNASTKEVHELIAIRLPDDEQRSLAELSALSPPELDEPFIAEPAAVLVAPPGQAGMAVVGDGTLDRPGRYLLMCMIPIGADPEAYLAAASSGSGPPQVDGGQRRRLTGSAVSMTVGCCGRCLGEEFHRVVQGGGRRCLRGRPRRSPIGLGRRRTPHRLLRRQGS